MTLSVTPSQNIPLWLTVRDTTGSILTTPTAPMSLKVSSGEPQIVQWDNNLGYCSYPMDTSICPGPMSLDIEVVGSSEVVTATAPASVQNRLPEGLQIKSNTVSSKTCTHFVAPNSNNMLSLVSFRPDDALVGHPTNLVWSLLPFAGNYSSVLVTIVDTTIWVIISTNYDIKIFSGAVPEHTNAHMQVSTRFTEYPASPGYTAKVLASTVLDSRPVLVTWGADAQIWAPATGALGGVLYNLDSSSEGALVLSSAVFVPHTRTVWLCGSTHSEGVSGTLIKWTLGESPVYFQKNSELHFSNLAATPRIIYLSGQTGVSSFTISTGVWSASSGKPSLDVLPVLWSAGDPWAPAPDAPEPVVLGVHSLVERTNPLADESGNFSLLTSEYWNFALLEETPAWAPDMVITPVPLPLARWDDRYIYEAPLAILANDTVSQAEFVQAPSHADLVDGLVTVQDPSRSFIVNLNPVPDPIQVTGSFLVVADSQVYMSHNPITKLRYSVISVSAPIPRLATLPGSSFPPNMVQASLTHDAEDNTLAPAFKAIAVGGNLLVSLVALNATSVQLGSDHTSLPPVLTDYVVPQPMGATHLTAVLSNSDHMVTVTTTIV